MLYVQTVDAVAMHLTLNKNKNPNPINRVHFVGTSAVLTIDQSHVRRLGIDDLTFLEEKPMDNGIVLEMHKFNTLAKEEQKP
jgi:hypothetical protein